MHAINRTNIHNLFTNINTMQVEAIIEENIHHFLLGMRTEYQGYKIAALVIQKYLKEGTITDDEELILKTQLMDSLKIIGIGIPFALMPGSFILMPIIIRVAEKHHIELVPSGFINKNSSSNKP